MVQAAGDNVIFKGGTSLSKGWNLIERFSEDIDIFLDPQAYSPALGANAIDRNLKKLSRAVQPEYEEQCKLLCYSSYPSWAEVLERFSELRDVL